MKTASADPSYDVFLCHNSKDKDAVRTIHGVLRQEFGLSAYLDEATLVGGEPWERAIQAALACSKACAVIVGPHGWGDYQLDWEARPAVRRRNADPSFRVVPVLLPGAKAEALADFADFFSPTHWITFDQSADEPTANRMLAYALRGENAFPEGPPRLSMFRVRFDAIRWETGARRDDSLLYEGKILHDAIQLVGPKSLPPIADFLNASFRFHAQRTARQLGAHARVLWDNPRQRDLAARLALESVYRMPTAEALDVLRHAYAYLHTTIGALTHPAPITAAVHDRANKRLATGCVDGSVLIWDGTTLRLIGKHAGCVRVAADLGASKFATGADDGTVVVWNWKTGEPVRQYQAGTTVRTLDGRTTDATTLLLASCGYPGSPGDVTVWNIDEDAQIWRMGMVTDAAFDATGAHVALAWGDHVVLRRTSDGVMAAKHPLNATVIGIATHPSRPWVAATTFDRRAHLVSFESNPSECRDLGNGTSRVSPVRIGANGRYVAAIRDDFRIAVWDLVEGTRQLLKYEGLIDVNIRFSDRSHYLAVVSPEAKVVTVWRLDTGQHVCTIGQEAPSVALFEDERNVLWTGSNGAVLSCVQMPRQQESFSKAAPGITQALLFAPNGTLAWSGLPIDDELRVRTTQQALWVVDPFKGVTRLDAMLPQPSRIAFDSEGRRIAAISDQNVRVWNLEIGTEVSTPEEAFWGDTTVKGSPQVPAEPRNLTGITEACRHRGRVAEQLSADGRLLAINHGKQLISIWSTSTGAEIVCFSAVAEVRCMVFSCDGALFATGDDRGGVMMWQTDGLFLGQVQHDEPISSLVFSPDGNYLAVASVDSALCLWIAAPSALVASVKTKVSGPLTDVEWARFLGDEPRDAL